MPEDRADRELLFEALAVHLGFVAANAPRVGGAARPSEGALPSSGSSSTRLVEDGLLTAGQSALLDGLVESLLARHDGDVCRCLESLSDFGRLRRALARVRSGHSSGHPTVSPIAIQGESSPPGFDSEVPIEDVEFDSTISMRAANTIPPMRGRKRGVDCRWEAPRQRAGGSA